MFEIVDTLAARFKYAAFQITLGGFLLLLPIVGVVMYAQYNCTGMAMYQNTHNECLNAYMDRMWVITYMSAYGTIATTITGVICAAISALFYFVSIFTGMMRKAAGKE